jgi:hypothetical protein
MAVGLVGMATEYHVAPLGIRTWLYWIARIDAPSLTAWSAAAMCRCAILTLTMAYGRSKENGRRVYAKANLAPREQMAAARRLAP